MIRLALRALARRWPELLAWYLAGWAARLMLIQFAGWAGSTNSLIGLSLLPLAVLARLASYIGMFLVLRSEMTRYRRGCHRDWDVPCGPWLRGLGCPHRRVCLNLAYPHRRR